MAEAMLARLVRLCDGSLAELGALRGKTGNLPRWSRLSRPDMFGFLRRQVEIAELAFRAGSPACYRHVHGLAERPYSAAEGRWLVTEMVAAVAECRLWALARRRKAAGAGGRSRTARRVPAGRAGRGLRVVRGRLVPVDPGRRLRGGREILTAMEGTYNYPRWRAFKREALKHDAPIEWPRGQGQPRAFENVLRLWLAERMEAAERERQKRANQWKLELDKKTGKRAYTGGDDAPLAVVKRPGGRRGR